MTRGLSGSASMYGPLNALAGAGSPLVICTDVVTLAVLPWDENVAGVTGLSAIATPPDVRTATAMDVATSNCLLHRGPDIDRSSSDQILEPIRGADPDHAASTRPLSPSSTRLR